MHRTIDGRQDPAKDPNGQAGMVGKALVVWLLIMAVLVVGIIDAVSIARTTLHASEIAAVAASDGAAAYRAQGHNLVKACEVSRRHDRLDTTQSLKLGRNGCTVDDAGRVDRHDQDGGHDDPRRSARPH